MLRLIMFVILEPEFLDLSLTARTSLPSYLRAFIASDMHIFGREKLAHFCEYIFKELHGLFLSDTEHIIRDAPVAPHLVRPSCTSEFGISCKSCQHMARQVNFRNHGDSLRSRILQDFLYLLLREPISLSIRSLVISLSVVGMADDGLVADRAYFGKARVFLDLKSPSLVVGEVPVQCVEFMYLHDVKVLLYFINTEEVT